ncbi:MAG TPA: SigB/SigF/SigG family RNA polymerase sigma factor [Pseudonocardiaceae bacterium]|jgi:RNA polymerase sigma-B factor|nr:SigB/SigF/SigG family RNA polymerase sigma factor [Pseudonocardiaceae bacterium]
MTVAKPQRTDYGEFAHLFDQLADDRLPEPDRRTLRDRIVAEHLPVAEHIARRFRNKGQPDDDLRQVAAIGLIQAVDRFDPTRGSDFLAFAVPTITGEVRRYFRDATWSMRVPRRVKELHAAITAKTVELSHELGRAPRPSELAEALERPVEEIHEGLAAANAYHSDSLDELVSVADGATTSMGDLLGDEDERLAEVVDREALLPALATLPERERAIVVLRFFGNLTQTQIADRVGLSQMHVSRLLAASIAQLHTAMTGGQAPGEQKL